MGGLGCFFVVFFVMEGVGGSSFGEVLGRRFLVFLFGLESGGDLRGLESNFL